MRRLWENTWRTKSRSLLLVGGVTDLEMRTASNFLARVRRRFERPNESHTDRGIANEINCWDGSFLTVTETDCVSEKTTLFAFF